jgi:hypothetical protein
MLFGSDGPWLHPGVELAKVRALGLSRNDEGLVLAGNFLRLTGSVGRSSRAMKADRPAHSQPGEHLAVEAMSRGDPWLQAEAHF